LRKADWYIQREIKRRMLEQSKGKQNEIMEQRLGDVH
jgi:hypothetical protein